MLSIGKVGGGQGDPRYYIDTVAKGHEDYYTGTGEAEGQWLGGGSAQKGLSGTVTDDDFLGLLGAGQVPGKTVLAYDLTFSAPKSVSVLYGIADAAVARIAREAHDEAVHQALGYLEREACWTRRGRAGRQRVRGEGLAVAAFRHRTSRAGDPQLHTHAVVANTTQALGTWTALDGRGLFGHAKTAGYVYQAALRAELTRTVGLEWTPVQRGVGEIAGIDPEVRRHFSRRSEEIRERMAERGGRSARSAQIATLETRRAKNYDVPIQRMREEWRARAGEMGLDSLALEDVLSRRAPGAPLPPDLATEALVIGGPHGVTREASNFDRRDVLRDWAEAHPEGASAERLEQLADRWLSSPAATPLEPDVEGRRVGGRKYSTPDMLDLEHQLLEQSSQRLDAGAGVVDGSTVDATLSEAWELADEQRELIRSLTTSGAGVEVVRAAAGTGKTYALARARDLWESADVPVYGCALAARAALELESTAGIDSTTIARLRDDLSRGYDLARGSVLVVDEAGMVGTRALAELADHAAATESKLVLVGDDRQLPELDAGGAFRGLAERHGALELRDVRRQGEGWDRDALNHLRHGKVREWATVYRDRGRVVAEPTAAKLREQLVTDWWHAARDTDADAVMIAHSRADVGALNDLARERMRLDGRLSAEQVVAGQRAFSVGDQVIARRNDRRLGILNGTRATVVGLDAEARVVEVERPDQTRAELDAAYLDDGHLDHGYALTAHAAQGATVDRAFVLGSEDLYREWAYTALSRHRTEARFYVVSPGSTERCLPGIEPEDDPLDRDVLRSLENSRRKDMASEVLDRGYGMDAERQAIETERAHAHAEALREQAAALRPWRRRERAELQALAKTHERAAVEWGETSGMKHHDASDRPSVPSVDNDVLRDGLVDPHPSLVDRIGGRPECVFERDEWASAGAILLTDPQLDLDAPLATGVELDDLFMDL